MLPGPMEKAVMSALPLLFIFTFLFIPTFLFALTLLLAMGPVAFLRLAF
jgi:hypothetical protein